MPAASLQGLVIILGIFALGLFFGFVMGFLVAEKRHTQKLDVPISKRPTNAPRREL